jgi:hypothetical protein
MSVVRVLAAALALGATLAHADDPRSDAPVERVPALEVTPAPPSYAAALAAWRSVDDVNAWIGERFAYDVARAARLSEAQRAVRPLPIHAPAAFYANPTGVCVDLARFGVETLRAIDPEANPIYVMIEFAPIEVDGAVLRRHWLAGFARGGARWFFADSKRPGHFAGPYATTAAFVADYARYRGRDVVAFRERDGFERAVRERAVRREKGTREAPPS